LGAEVNGRVEGAEESRGEEVDGTAGTGAAGAVELETVGMDV